MICKLINQICRKISTTGDFNSLEFWEKPTRQHQITGHALLIWFSVPAQGFQFSENLWISV